ncbi:uncharacterized protein LOC117890034 isoform X2 [Drosophila subobscura]|uniref:uncharacterized protein LOC117890034 isoform X2 n=1 Tax=Drosophila subobscura TaxID=7241 RepID=UPI00155B289D|nr:uncharacterized protein LOC117890034 isoform X2 [Drosophila subobscura]
MVSRRKILSRSRDDLNLDQTFTQQEEEEDVWYQKDKLYKEHIQEVLDKWTQIDDEIWAKVIVFERNRRVAKAYARAPVLTINGSDDGFDGMRIGLCGFDNPMRDQKTDEMKRVIGQGVKIKMDDAGNILVRRYAKSNVYVKSTASSPNEETSIGAEILKLPNQALESEKIVKLFDMKKFQSNVNRELRRAYPDRRRLETQCLSAVAFVKSESDVLECPIWVLIVNVVAMDMLKSKLPPVQRPIVDIKNRPRIPIPDEDPYSVAGNGSGGSSGSSGFGSGHQQQAHPQQLGKHMNNGNSGHVAATREQLLLQTQQLAHKRSEKPPKLPPRDNVYAHDLIPKPDYDDIDLETRIKLSRGKSDKGKDNKKYDDPYYCGLRARVPNFGKSGKKGSGQGLKDQRDGNGNNINIINNNNNLSSNGGMSTLSQKKTSMIHNHLAGMHPHHIQQQQQQQQLMAAAAAAHAVHHHNAGHQQQNHHHPIWQTRSYESGIGIYKHKTHALQMQLQLQQQQQQQQPQSLPTDLTTTATAKTQSTPNKARSQQQQQQLQHQHHLTPQTRTPHSYPHAHPHPKHQNHHQNHHNHNHSHMHQCERHARHQPTLPPYYDNLEESLGRQVTRRLSTRRPLAESACNCVSCYALAPLCGSVPPPRPQRSLSQQQLRRHQRLSGSLVEKQAGVVKWCSESDISVLEHVQEEDPADERYDDCYEYDDFDMDFDIDDDLTARMGYSRGTETVDMYVDRAQLRQIQAPAVLASSRTKSQSTESFFEQPNEEGSLYMYGGRKRIVAKAPSAANIYDRVRGSMDPDRGYANGRFNLAARTQQYQSRSSAVGSHKAPVLPSPSWRGGKRQQQQEAKHFQNSDKRRYDNATNNNNNISSSSSNKNKRQLTNSNKNNDDILKSKNNFNSKTKSIATSASAAAQSQVAKATTTSASSGGAVAAAATMTTNASGGAAAAAAASKKASPIIHDPTTANNALAAAAAAANGLLHGPPPPPAARTGRSASRLDISDMESIYGYLKPRKPRSLSLKKIQILDY